VTRLQKRSIGTNVGRWGQQRRSAPRRRTEREREKERKEDVKKRERKGEETAEG